MAKPKTDNALELLDVFLRTAQQQGASAVVVEANCLPAIVIGGKTQKLSGNQIPTVKEVKAMLAALAPQEERTLYHETGYLKVTFGHAGLSGCLLEAHKFDRGPELTITLPSAATPKAGLPIHNPNFFAT